MDVTKVYELMILAKMEPDDLYMCVYYNTNEPLTPEP